MKILIIKPSSLGDIIHSLPFLKALRDTFQEARIEWVISRNLKDILEGHPLINRLIVFDKDSWKSLKNLPRTFKEVAELIKKLKAEHYDMVIDLQGLLRSGFMTFVVHSPLKIGFKHAREGSSLFYNKKVSTNGALHAVDKCLEVAKAVGAETEEIAFPLYIHDDERKKIKGLIGNISEYAVLAPSTRWKTKRWPPASFGSLITKLPVPCVITGGHAEKQIANEVMSSSGGKGIDLCGKTGLKGLTALISEAEVVVSNDSGPMHIAAALGVPVIALFGPTDPEKTGPYGWHVNKDLKVLRSFMKCSPCFKRECREPLCMSGISVEMVLKEIKEYL